ncbi:MAG: hypothetical protein JW986_10950 [Methanotrichaceae archaeon]|nr:hypothetical protein [Methanotrichaceae archaeon]
MSQFTTKARSDLVSVEVTGESAYVVLTHGTISIWFGRNAAENLVSRILMTISKVDYATEHEKEVLCDFEEINEFENNGYILSSYARKDTRYRAIFVVPFSNRRALDSFVASVQRDLEHNEVRMTLRWRGGLARMRILCQELRRLDCFALVTPAFRDNL